MDVDPSTEPLPPNNTAESALPKPPRGGEKEKERDEMEKKMHAVHETRRFRSSGGTDECDKDYMLTASEEKLERTQSSLLTVTAKLAAAEEENNHLAGERDDARDECDAANEEIARLKIEIHGLESQIDKMDDSRARKRPTPPVCTLKGKPKIQVALAGARRRGDSQALTESHGVNFPFRELRLCRPLLKYKDS
ncbi:hypothetical protein R3P38DRAFT_2812235 [Favolaschia claudopus]|uniref:Tropomyosin n=1 Tax=Favolaschia claudopus TaxID=2862362 RepID=A0AAV9Z7V6_9AGAR